MLHHYANLSFADKATFWALPDIPNVSSAAYAHCADLLSM